MTTAKQLGQPQPEEPAPFWPEFWAGLPVMGFAIWIAAGLPGVMP